MVQHKKRSASRRKPSSSAPPSTTVDQTTSSSSSSLSPPLSDDFSAAGLALTEFEEGNHEKSLQIIKESLSKHKDSGILYQSNAIILLNLANLAAADSNARLNYLNDSAESAQRATILFPDTVSFSFTYVQILVELSKHNKEYDKVIRECDRALSIENPIDPLNASHEVNERIQNVREKIREFKEGMNVVKIVDFDGEERIKFRVVDDEEDRSERNNDLKQEKESNEIKKRIEEVRNEKKKLGCDFGHDFDFGFDSTRSRVSDEKKLTGLKKIAKLSMKTKPVRKYWNEGMSGEKKKRLLEFRIDELKEYFDEDNVAREMLMEAIGYAEENGTWKFWECFCGEKFVDCETGMKHYEENHEKILPEKLGSVVPSEVDPEWVDMIENWDWRPVDTLAAAKIIRIAVAEIITGSDLGIDKEWPLSDDTERAKILKRIRCMLQLFLRHKCLAKSLLKRVIEYAREKLLALIDPSQFQMCNLNKTLQCLRLLGLPELNNALKILQEVCNICDLTRLMQDEVSDNQVLDNKERIVFSSDFECLLLDQRLLQDVLVVDMYRNAVEDDGSAVTSAVDDRKDDVLPIGDIIITWLYSFPIEEQVASWTQLRGDKLGLEVFEVLDKEFSNLKSMCERKCDFSTCKKAVCEVNYIFLEENNMREQFPESKRQSYASLLRERRRELFKRDGDAVFRSSQLQLNAIQDVLEEALSLSFNQFKSEECGKGDNRMMQHCLVQANRYTQEAIRRKNTCLLDKYAKVDAMIMRNVAAMHQFKLKLRLLCAYDYRSIMLPLLKFFMQARLEDLVDKDALEKSKAAEEAFLADLTLDAKKNISKGSDHDKQMQQKSKNKKSKDKKKKRDRRKPKEFKGTGENEDLLLHHEDAEQVDIPVASLRADELGEQEEELRHKIELEEQRLAEILEYQRQFENEAKEKCLSEQNSITIGKTAVNMIEGVPDKQPKSEFRGVSSSEYEKSQQDWLVDETGIPKVSSSFPESTVKGTMKKSSSVSGTQWRKKRSLSHAKFEQGPPYQGKSEGALPSDQRKECQSSDSGALLTEKEMHEGGSLQIEGSTRVKILDQDNIQRHNITFKELDDFPLKAEQKMPERMSLEGEEFGPLQTDAWVNDKNKSIDVGTVLKNDFEEFNCFLNVIIQSLWNLRRFRDEVMASAELMHIHFGDPCVACELCKLFSHLSISATEMQKKAVDPTSLRISLSNLVAYKSIFEEGQMNDASEVLGIIFTSLHESFSSCLNLSYPEIDGRIIFSMACISSSCLVHQLFGLTITEKMNCVNCDLVTRRLQYTNCLHKIDASELRRMKSMHSDRSFDELLKLEVMNHQLDCDSEEGGCGNLNHIDYILLTPPQFFTTVLEWQTNYESEDDVSATLRALTMEIDLGLVYPNLVPGNKYCIVSVVCYYQLHYICFAYSQDHKTWIMYDDETVKFIGCWGDVLTKCIEWHYQPQVLFFEAM